MANRAYALAVVIRDLPIGVIAHVLTFFFQRVNLPTQLLDSLRGLPQSRGEVAPRGRRSGERGLQTVQLLLNLDQPNPLLAQSSDRGLVVFQLSRRRRWLVLLLRPCRVCSPGFAGANPGTTDRDPWSTALPQYLVAQRIAWGPALPWAASELLGVPVPAWAPAASALCHTRQFPAAGTTELRAPRARPGRKTGNQPRSWLR
eukprot:3065940-Rhodomonas_salina.2